MILADHAFIIPLYIRGACNGLAPMWARSATTHRRRGGRCHVPPKRSDCPHPVVGSTHIACGQALRVVTIVEMVWPITRVDVFAQDRREHSRAGERRDHPHSDDRFQPAIGGYDHALRAWVGNWAPMCSTGDGFHVMPGRSVGVRGLVGAHSPQRLPTRRRGHA